MIAEDVELGEGVIIHHPELVNLYGCKIGDGCNIAAFVEIGAGAVIGKYCKIGSGVFIPPGVTIEDGCFIGPNVVFTNDLYPLAVDPETGEPIGPNAWALIPTLVKQGAAIGANSTIRAGVVIGAWSLVGCGSVVTRDVPFDSTVYGNPARVRVDSDITNL